MNGVCEPHENTLACVLCPQGKYNPESWTWPLASDHLANRLLQCSACPGCGPGTWRAGCGGLQLHGDTTDTRHQAGSCSSCSRGTYKTEGASAGAGVTCSACTTCGPGEAINGCGGLPLHLADDAGRNSPGTCTPCAHGQYSGATDRLPCLNCPAGKFTGSNVERSSQCQDCFFLLSSHDQRCVDTSQNAPAVGEGAGSNLYPPNSGQAEGSSTGVQACNPITGVVTSFFVKPSNTCDDPASLECTQATQCNDPDSADPCDAPERCYSTTAPICYSSRSGESATTDQRFDMAVSGLPQVAEGGAEFVKPIYTAYAEGGVSSNFVNSFDKAMANTDPYRVTNSPLMSDVSATCNAISVNIRAKYYWAASSTRLDCGTTQAEDRWTAGAEAPLIIMQKGLDGAVSI